MKKATLSLSNRVKNSSSTNNKPYSRTNSRSNTFSLSKGFTIVELLVVIVVIGILAAITIVAYTGISSKATVASLQSDLSNAKKQLALYQVEHSAFPTLPLTITGNNYCPSDDINYCFKASSGNVLTYSPTTTTNPQSFTLVNTNTASTTRYTITNNSSPVTFSANWIAGTAGTALANKWVYNADLTTYRYKTNITAVVSPQGATGLDPNYLSNMVLVSPQTNPGVDFSEYPAQDACKAIGGRLPNMQELLAIYAGRVTTYGNNFQLVLYWSATEYTVPYPYTRDFNNNGSVVTNYNTSSLSVRCISG